MTATYLLTSGNLLWKILDKYGQDPEPVFFQEGVRKEMLFEEEKRISLQHINRLWIKAARLIEDPCFGLEAAGFWHPSYFGALGYAWLASTTLRKALERLDRYIHIIYEKIDIKLEKRKDGLNLILSDSIQPPAFMDSTMAVIISMCRLNMGDDFHPLSVNIIHEKPNCSGRYFQLFRAPVHFGAESDSILFSYDDLDLRLPSGNPHLANINDQMMIEYLANLDGENIIHRVKSAIIEHMHDGKITVNMIAKEVFMSVRSLHRNLNELGTTFGSILDEVRREFAEHYVSDTREDLTEVAFRLGFSEQSSFSRAFKRWMGMSPSAYRADLKNQTLRTHIREKGS
jgi:AraC-like DNA-binding protein